MLSRATQVQFDWHDHHFNGLYYTTTAQDALLPQSTKRALCRSVLFDARMQHERDKALEPIAEFEALLGARTLKAVNSTKGYVNFLYELTMAMFTCIGATFIAMLMIQQRTPLLRQLQILRILNVVNILAAILMLVCHVCCNRPQRCIAVRSTDISVAAGGCILDVLRYTPDALEPSLDAPTDVLDALGYILRAPCIWQRPGYLPCNATPTSPTLRGPVPNHPFPPSLPVLNQAYTYSGLDDLCFGQPCHWLGISSPSRSPPAGLMFGR